jgi:TonB family protein
MNKIISLQILLTLSLLCFQLQAQVETKKIKKKTDYTIEEVEVMKSDKSVFHGSYKKMTKGGIPLEQGFYRNGVKDGVWIYYLRSKPEQSGSYENGKKAGIWKYYNRKGSLEQEFDYTFMKLVSSSDGIYNVKCDVLIDGEFIEKEVEMKATYIGGISYALNKFLKIGYPREAKRQGLSGKVIIEFEIDEFGKASNHKIKQSAGTVLDDAVLKGFKSLPNNWLPAIYEKKSITSKIVCPFTFKLN